MTHNIVLIRTMIVMLWCGGCQAAFRPVDEDALKAAVGNCHRSGWPNWVYHCTGGCLGETGDGSCPTFAASLDATGNPYGVIGDWDTSLVTGFRHVFYYANAFNQDLSKWNTSAVIKMNNMFYYASAFNSDVSNWDTSKVVTMQSMFQTASAFNSDVSKWDTGAVENMGNMFNTASAFNSDVSNWNTGAVELTHRMFSSAPAFNSDLSKWDTSSVEYMGSMFKDSGFTRTLCGGAWESLTGSDGAFDDLGSSTARVGCCSPGTFMAQPNLNPFSQATACEACPSGQVGSSVDDDITSCNKPFTPATLIELKAALGTCERTCQPWPNYMDCVTVCNPGGCLGETEDGSCPVFAASLDANGNPYGVVSDWNTSLVTSMSSVFHYAVAFNQDLSKWDTSAVTNMELMFYGASSFNSDVSKWNTGAVTDMQSMFHQATVFNQDLSKWDVSAVTTMYSMFSMASSFNSDVSKWNTGAVTDMATMFGSTPFNQDVSNWDTSAVTDMYAMFILDLAFDQDVSNWDTSAVTNMESMFQQASAFNQDVSKWSTSVVRNMGYMFYNATAFNSDVSKWDTSAVTYMGEMFYDSGFTRALCGGAWESLAGSKNAFESVGTSTARIGCPTCDDVDGSGADFASCVSGTSHLKDVLTNTCATGTCTVLECCDANPTCDDVDGSGTDFASCGGGTNHLKGVLTNTCATGTCTASDCCDANPTCDDIDGSGTDFASCVGGTNHLKGVLTNTCATDTCTVSDCCDANPTCATFDNTNGCTGGSYTGALIAAAASTNCAGATCDNSDAAACCEPETAKCATFDATNGCNGGSYTGTLIAAAASTNCAGTTCGVADAATCCQPKPFTPATLLELKAALGTCNTAGYICTGGCLGETEDGSCPVFAASLDANGKPYGVVSDWDTSLVTEMTFLFAQASSFNQPIGQWNTEKVDNMGSMFHGASSFNQPIGQWKTDNLRYMNNMFNGASSFNQPIGQWKTDKVTNMHGLFDGASSFNQPIGQWNTVQVLDMAYMFHGASLFNQHLSNWNTGAVTTMNAMFYYAWAFNQDVSNWNTGAVTNMQQMFQQAPAFNQDVANWNTGAVTNMVAMFAQTNQFNQDLSKWNTGAVTNMHQMFRSANFNQDVSKWNMGAVTTMSEMFYQASAFNQDVSNWNTGAVTNMYGMFYQASAFNSDLSKWNTGAVTSMYGMFEDSGFTRTLCGGTWESLAGDDSAFNNLGSSTARLGCCSPGTFMAQPNLNPFSKTTACEACPTGQVGTGGDDDITSCVVPSAWFTPANRAALQAAVDTCFSETVDGSCPILAASFDPDGNPYGVIGDWDVSAVTQMDTVFLGKGAFNQDVSKWNTGAATTMSEMFYYAAAFNQDVSNWDTRAVTSMKGMFDNAASFNQDVSKWNTGLVTTMRSMFSKAGTFNQDLSKWNTGVVTTMDNMFDSASAFNSDLSKWDTTHVTTMNAMFDDSGVTQTFCGGAWESLTGTSSAFRVTANNYPERMGTSTARLGPTCGAGDANNCCERTALCRAGFSGANCQTVTIEPTATATDIRATFTDLSDRLVAFKASAKSKVTAAKRVEIENAFNGKPNRQKRERVKASKVVLTKQDLPPIYTPRRKKMKNKIAIVAVEYEATAPDCTGVEQDSDGIPNCCSYNILDDPDTSVIVGTHETVDAWSVLCEGTTVISKQTRTTLTNANGIGTYTMQCWNGAAFGNAVATQSGLEHTCGDYLLLIGSTTFAAPGSNPVCLHPDVPVHVLRGASVETVAVATLEIGDLVIGEGKTSAVQRVEHFKVDDEACVVPKDLCGGFVDHVVVSRNHAVRCPSWPANTWTFCQPEWQRVATTKYVHVVLESYIDDHLLSGSVVLESWDGYSRNTDSIEEACGQRGCPWPHKWVSVGEQRWTRQDLRTTLVDSTPRLRLTLP